jgi:serine/threonine protein kinase
VVFLVWDTALEREVALKVPRAETLLHSKTRDRFLREIRTTAQFQHPHIATIYDGGMIGPIFFIASEYCAGGSLAGYLEHHAADHRLSPEAAASVMVSIADAAHHAHQRGILHRDIKPSNILLDCPAEALPQLADHPEQLGKVSKLVDFGLAKDLAREDPRTRTGILIGTPGYTAPEIVWQHSRSTALSDVYSLGATLYHLVTGGPPLLRDSAFQTLVAGQNEVAPPPSRIVPSIPSDIDAICQQCLEKEPHRRYPSAQDLADDLRRYLNGVPIRARRTSSFERAIRWCRRNSLVATLIATTTALFLIAGTSLLFFWQSFLAQKTLSAEIREHAHKLQVRRVIDQGYRTMGVATQNSANESRPPQLELSPDGQLAAVALAQEIRLWQLQTGESIVTLPLSATQLAFHDAAHLLIATPPSPQVQKVRLLADERGTFAPAPWEDPRELATAPDSYWARSPLGQLVAILGTDGSVQMWDRSIPPWPDKLPITGEIQSLAVSPKGDWLAVHLHGSDIIEVMHTQDGQSRSRLTVPNCQGVTIAPTGSVMAIVHDGTCELWDTSTWRAIGRVSGRVSSGRVAFSPNGSLLATMESPEMIALYSVLARTSIDTLSIHDKQPPVAIRFSPRGDELIACSLGGVIHIWDLAWISERLVLLNPAWNDVHQRLLSGSL